MTHKSQMGIVSGHASFFTIWKDPYTLKDNPLVSQYASELFESVRAHELSIPHPIKLLRESNLNSLHCLSVCSLLYELYTQAENSLLSSKGLSNSNFTICEYSISKFTICE